MAEKRRNTSQFNLAFLDVMCCGFGAVVLLVMLLHGDMLTTRREVTADLQSEVTRLEREAKVGRENLVSIQNSLQQTEEEIVRTEGLSRQVLARVDEIQDELATMEGESFATRENIAALKSDLLTLDKEGQRIGAEQQTELARGSQVRKFVGQGDRQYLTGLRLGGKRVLLLVDASASMLDETILNIIVRRNLDDQAKRSAPKWRRTVRTAEWLLANLPASSSVQVVLFNTKTWAAASDLKGQWVPINNRSAVDRMLATVRKTIPQEGTSLYHAFAAATKLKPHPDNILLLTDGLPTQAERKPSKTTVSGDERLKFFKQATRRLPKGVPVNTILFPMEGDPMAAISFWQLALDTGGSFLTPTRDWP